MTGPDPIEQLAHQRVLPVVTIDDIDDVAGLVGALVEGGLAAVEITLRTPVALAAIEQAANDFPDALIGTGSVTSAKLARAAIDAGAGFLVSPGLYEDAVDAARSRDITIVPGVGTATELGRAVEMGFDVVKLFPATQLGGVGLISAFAAVWPNVRIVPTGGINADTAPDYLAHDHVLAVGGSWMMPKAALAARDWSAIASASATAAQLGAAQP